MLNSKHLSLVNKIGDKPSLLLPESTVDDIVIGPAISHLSTRTIGAHQVCKGSRAECVRGSAKSVCTSAGGEKCVRYAYS